MNAIATQNRAQAAGPAWTADYAPQEKSSFVITLLAIYVFLLSSRALDISRAAFLHIPMVLLGFLVLATLAKGDLRYAFGSKITRCYVALNFWVLLAFPFSRWRGGSMPSIINSIESFGVYLIIVQLLRTDRDWRRVANWYAYGVLLAAILSIFFGQMIDGWLAIAAGSLADPNEFALRLALGLPFWWYMASQSNVFKKLICFALTVPILAAFGRAGSRSGLLALLALVVVMFVCVNVTQKMVMGAVAGIAVVAAVAFLPDYLKVRFTTLFTKHDTANLSDLDRSRLGADIGSSEGREMLLRQAIEMTLEHPLVGVGPGVFGDVAFDERKRREGFGGALLVSHNTYTQISSETGIPGFLCFVATLFFCIKYSLSDYRRYREQNPGLARSSLYLFCCLAGLAAGIFFLSIGYGMVLATLFGLAGSRHLISESEASAATEAIPEPAAAPVNTTPAPLKPQENVLNGRRVRFGRFAPGRSRAQ